MKKLIVGVVVLLLVGMVGYGQEWESSGNYVYLDDDADSVGIGTDEPLGKLHVSSGTSGDAVLIIEADTDNGPDEFDNPMIIFRQDGGKDITAFENYNNELRIRNSVGGAGGISFETGEVTGLDNAVTRMHIKANGKIGIGTKSPTDKLDVNGIVKMSGFKLTAGSPEDGDVLAYNATSGEGEWRTISGGGGSCLWDGDLSETYYMGNVGIGTDDPTTKLDVVGDIKIPYDNRMYFGGPWIQGYNVSSSYGGLKFYGNGGGGAGNLAITVNPSGKVGIATEDPQSELAVNGTITAKEILVTLDGFPDFVFGDSYQLLPLDKLERHIKKEKSLPGIPTEKEVLKDGVNLGEMQAKLLEKVEELTLYTIAQEKRLAKLEQENEELKKQISSLNDR